jgi:hypothetical protein
MLFFKVLIHPLAYVLKETSTSAAEPGSTQLHATGQFFLLLRVSFTFVQVIKLTDVDADKPPASTCTAALSCLSRTRLTPLSHLLHLS